MVVQAGRCFVAIDQPVASILSSHAGTKLEGNSSWLSEFQSGSPLVDFAQPGLHGFDHCGSGGQNPLRPGP